MGVKVAITSEEIEAANECLEEFQDAIESKCGPIRLLGILLAVPNAEGTYGVLAVKSEQVYDEDFARLVKDMGAWMTRFTTQ